MPTARGDLTQSALDAFGVSLAGRAAPADARSGAGVHRVRLLGGAPAYLKVSTQVAAAGATAGLPDDGGALAAAERELRFYRDVAPEAPVRTPALLAALSTEDGVALLLGDAGVQRDVTAWAPHRWRALGRDLARLHAMPVPAGSWDRADGLLAALADADLDRVAAFWSGHVPRLEELLADRGALRERLRSAPQVFVHADCHTGNVLHARAAPGGAPGDDGSGLVFCDWQESGTGRASSDLALLSVRATPSGTHVPDTVVQEYARQRARDGAQPDEDALRRDVLLEELTVLVFLWPPFAAYNDATGTARVRRRARLLAERL